MTVPPPHAKSPRQLALRNLCLNEFVPKTHLFLSWTFSQSSVLDKRSTQLTCCFLNTEIKVNNTADLGCFSRGIVQYKEAICHSGGAGGSTMKCSRDSSAGMSKSNGWAAQKWKGNRRGTFPAEGCVVIDLCTIQLTLTATAIFGSID